MIQRFAQDHRSKEQGARVQMHFKLFSLLLGMFSNFLLYNSIMLFCMLPLIIFPEKEENKILIYQNKCSYIF